jgi:hypothetical protein
MDGPPPRLTPDQRAAAARLREAGMPAGIALDVAAGRIAEADALKWLAEYQTRLAAERAKWSMRGDSNAGGG